MSRLVNTIERLRDIFDIINNSSIIRSSYPIDPIVEFVEKAFIMPSYHYKFIIHNANIAKGTPKIYYVLNSVYRKGKKEAGGPQNYFSIRNLEYNAYVDISNNNRALYEVKIEAGNIIARLNPVDFYKGLVVYSYHLILINKLLLSVWKFVLQLDRIDLYRVVSRENFFVEHRTYYYVDGNNTQLKPTSSSHVMINYVEL